MYRPSRPESCPPALWDAVIFPCWERDPLLRCSWDMLLSRMPSLEQCIASLPRKMPAADAGYIS
jgi:hypothetical protein